MLAAPALCEHCHVEEALWRRLTRISPSSNASSSSPSLESLVTIGLSIEGWLTDAVSDAGGNGFTLS